MATLSTTPAFAHDCTQCRLIAHVQPRTGQAFDLYRCQDGDGSVVARTGDEGPDYVSLPPEMVHMVRETDSTMGRALWLVKHESTVRGLMAL